LDRVAEALRRAGSRRDPIDVAAALAYEIAAAQGFYEGNKRTALVIARWYLRENTELNPAVIVLPDDRDLGDLLIKLARGDDVATNIEELLRARAASSQA
jgi:prophage maintenance system killer protein